MIHLLLEDGNRELKDRMFFIPDGVRSHLQKTLEDYNEDGADRSIEGYERLNNLLGSRYVAYNEMKRLKNFFDNYHGTTTNPTYILNGGSIMRNWVNSTLSLATTTVRRNKEAMRNAGKKNAFKKPHTRGKGLTESLPTVILTEGQLETLMASLKK